MKTKLGILALLAALLVYGAERAASSPARLAPASVAEPASADEVARIRAHLEEVEAELLDRDVSHLSPTQRAARARHIRVLREYREAGVFPHNHDFPGERVPYFVDEHGTLCAMAYLIQRSGRGDLVERVASTANNARITELAADPELVAWLAEAGLSVEEAARIQPTYGCCWVEPGREEGSVGAGYAVAAALSNTAAGAGIALNLRSLRSGEAGRGSAVLGVLAGAAGLGLGIDRLDDGGPAATLGAVTAGLGLASATLGTWNLFRVPADRETPAEAVATDRETASLTATPLVTVDRRGGGVGVLLRLAF